MKRTMFDPAGRFYKGNLHTHTTVSDGEKTPEEAKAVYKNAGYDFMAVTDHNIYRDYSELCDPDFIVLPGIEAGYGYKHVVGIGTPQTVMKHDERLPQEIKTLQAAIDFLAKKQILPIVAHPMWSALGTDELAELTGYLGVEILNRLCEMNHCTGDASAYFEYLDRHHKPVFRFAADDNHFAREDNVSHFVMVKTGDFSAAGIVKALQSGSFYASSGPLIHDFYYENGTAVLECSNAASVYIGSQSLHLQTAAHADSAPVTRVEWRVPVGAAFLTAVVVDRYKRKAYAQPIRLSV